MAYVNPNPPLTPSSGNNILLGGLGASTNPSDYAVGNPQGTAINNLMGNGTGAQGQQLANAQIQQAQQLQQIASGQTAGAGELAVNRQVAAAQAAQQAQARMARGGANAGLAFRNAANNTASVGLAGAGQAQQAALSDQMNANQALTGALGSARGQDINMYGQNLGALTGLNAQQLSAQQAAMQSTLSQQGILGGLLNTGGQVGAAALMSDERLKTDIKDADSDIDDMLSKLHAKEYSYTDEKYGKGPRVGIMAQDMAKSKAGARVIASLPDGHLGLDINKAISAALASSARLHQRMTKLEKHAG